MFSLRSGFSGLSISDWFSPAPPATPDASEALEQARDAMLAVLGEAGRTRNARLALRIGLACDAQSLWAMRPELMTEASKLIGEAEAHRRLVAATVSFESLLPALAGGSRRPHARLTAARARSPIAYR